MREGVSEYEGGRGKEEEDIPPVIRECAPNLALCTDSCTAVISIIPISH